MNALQKLIVGTLVAMVGMLLICFLGVGCGPESEEAGGNSNVQPPATNSPAPLPEPSPTPVPVDPGVQITSFSFPNLSAVGEIDQVNATIDVTVRFGTDISSLTPVITTTPGATVTPASGEAQSFNDVDMQYFVEDDDYHFRNYTVTVWVRWDQVDSPHIVIISVPDVGQGGSAVGQVSGIRPSELGEYQIALYIKVWGGWWVKPYFGSTVSINPNGVWYASVTTGGHDTSATEIRAYLVPADFEVPQLRGSGSLPDSLDSFPYDSVER